VDCVDSCPMDGRISSLETKVDHIEHILDDNGQPGLVTNFTRFAAKWEAREEERDKQLKHGNAVWNLRIAALVFILSLAEFAMHGCAKRISFSDMPSVTPQTAQQQSDLPPTYKGR
jgi:hypothetical protein